MAWIVYDGWIDKFRLSTDSYEYGNIYLGDGYHGLFTEYMYSCCKGVTAVVEIFAVPIQSLRCAGNIAFIFWITTKLAAYHHHPYILQSDLSKASCNQSIIHTDPQSPYLATMNITTKTERITCVHDYTYPDIAPR